VRYAVRRRGEVEGVIIACQNTIAERQTEELRFSPSCEESSVRPTAYKAK